MANKRVGGTLFVALNGVRLRVKGNWSVGGFSPKREGVPGMDEVHGYTEKVQVPFIEGEATIGGDDDLPALLAITDATITAELSNGKVAVLRNGWHAGDGVYGTEEGSVPLRFEGLSLDFT